MSWDAGPTHAGRGQVPRGASKTCALIRARIRAILPAHGAHRLVAREPVNSQALVLARRQTLSAQARSHLNANLNRVSRERVRDRVVARLPASRQKFGGLLGPDRDDVLSWEAETPVGGHAGALEAAAYGVDSSGPASLRLDPLPDHDQRPERGAYSATARSALSNRKAIAAGSQAASIPASRSSGTTYPFSYSNICATIAG